MFSIPFYIFNKDNGSATRLEKGNNRVREFRVRQKDKELEQIKQ